MTWAIQVNNLSKLYRIGSETKATETFYANLFSKFRTMLSRKPQEKLISDEALARTDAHMMSESQTADAPPGYFWALKDVSFTIEQGDRIGLIGRNGSGKSTLLKILSRITKPTLGEFRYRGKLVSLLEVGTGFHVELSGRDNIYLNAAINGMTRKEVNKKFNEIVEFSELGERIDTPVKRYSSGMYMRLAFSVAAHLESEILLIDEVLAVGDSGFQKQCREKMLEVANNGRTVLLVSHDMRAIEMVCDKAIEMSHGQVVKAGLDKTAKSEDNPKSQDSIRLVREATLDYLKINQKMVSYKNWLKQARLPGNEVVQVESMALVNEDLNKTEFTVRDPIHIKVVYHVLKPNVQLTMGIRLFDIHDKLVLQSCHNLNSIASFGQEHPVGKFEVICTIPEDYLNNTVYSVALWIFTDPDIKHVCLDQVLRFIVSDNYDQKGVRGNLTLNWPDAVVRPRLSWSEIASVEVQSQDELVIS